MDFKEIILIVLLSLLNNKPILIQLDLAKLPSVNSLEIFATVISSIMAAIVAYYVANLQIKSREKELSDLNAKIYNSHLKLIVHNLRFNKKVINHALTINISEESTSIFLRERLVTSVWDETRITLVTHSDTMLFDEMNEVYTRISLLKLEHGYTEKLASQTNNLIDLLLEKIS